MRVVAMGVLGLALSAGAAFAQDVSGSKDHPVITRYPGSVIRWYAVDNHRPYRVPTGPVSGYRKVEKGVDTEGRVTRLYYALDGGVRTHAEVYRNYRDALASGGFEILAEGLVAAGARSSDVGSRAWREVLYLSNPWNDNSGAVNEMAGGTATSGGGGAVVARKVRAEGTAYVVVSVFQYRADRVGALVDVVEVKPVETGRVVVDANAIAAGIRESGRVVLDGLLFDFDQATLTPASKAALEQIAIYLKANPARSFYVVGHTDSKGTFAHNRDLSAERARTVVLALLRDHGIAEGRLEPHGAGPLAPVLTNASDAGRERNRRVELVER